MKHSTLLATGLAIALASPTTATVTTGTTSVASRSSTGDTTTTAVRFLAAADCKPCDNQYKKCIGSFCCWFNPDGCYISCNKETCDSDVGGEGFCRRQCGYDKYC